MGGENAPTKYKSKRLWTKFAPPLCNANGRRKMLSPDMNMVSKEKSFKGEIACMAKINNFSCEKDNGRR